MTMFRLTILSAAVLAAMGITTAPWRSQATAGPACPVPRFTVTSGWVLDATTKLNWQQTFLTGRSWDLAKTDCTGLGGGARLPSLTELQSIVDDSKKIPAIDLVAFPSTPSSAFSSGFWTSSEVSGSPGDAWLVFFSFGHSSRHGASFAYAVRCVR